MQDAVEFFSIEYNNIIDIVRIYEEGIILSKFYTKTNQGTHSVTWVCPRIEL